VLFYIRKCEYFGVELTSKCRFPIKQVLSWRQSLWRYRCCSMCHKI